MLLALLSFVFVRQAPSSLRSTNSRDGGWVRQLQSIATTPTNNRQQPYWEPTNATRCSQMTPPQSLKVHQKSQRGEDQQLLEWFSGLCGGRYLEMGGLDGITFSNTFVFQQALQWTGVLVELGPTNYAKLKVNRPYDTTIHAAVCGTPQTIHYYERDATGGIWEFTPPSFRDRWWQGARLEDCTVVDCVPLQTILEQTMPHQDTFFFDFFSLDIEGAELEALQSLDHTRVGFGVIVVEADEHNPLKNMALRLTLLEAGYQYLEQESTRDSYNQWFVHPQFHTIYQDWIH